MTDFREHWPRYREGRYTSEELDEEYFWVFWCDVWRLIGAAASGRCLYCGANPLTGEDPDKIVY